MTNTSSEFFSDIILVTHTKPPSHPRTVTEASQPHHASDHKLLLTSIVHLFLSIKMENS